MESGEWRVESGEWRVVSGEWDSECHYFICHIQGVSKKADLCFGLIVGA